MNLFLNFYGDDIQSQKWQIETALRKLFDLMSLGNNTSNQSDNKKNDKNEQFLLILKRILEIKNIDQNCHAKYYSILSYVYEVNEIDIVKKLLQTENIDAISNQNIEIAKLLIEDKRTNINICILRSLIVRNH